MSGIEVLEQLKKVAPDTEAVVMTGHASMETAVQAVRLGAFDYITKPCKLAEIEAVLCKVAEQRELKHKNLALQSRVKAAEGPTVLVGKSPADDGRPSHDRHGGPDRIDGADPRRDGHRQGTGGAGAVAAEQAQRHAVRAGQLRGAVGKSGRERTVRPPQGRVHGGRPRPQGPLRGGQRRHAVPRRAGRAEQEHPGEAAALPGVGRDPPAWATPSRSAWTCACCAPPTATCGR